MNSAAMTAVTPENTTLLHARADQCVKCGLCLPHCPTFSITGSESEGPRGRIAIIQGLAREELAPSEKAWGHLDRCLQCRACEAVCPAQVEFGTLMDQARAELPRPGKRHGAWERLGFFVVRRRRWRRAIQALTWLGQRSGFVSVGRHLGLWRLLGLARPVAMLPRAYWPKRIHGHPGGGERRVQLFTGCMSESMAPEELTAGIGLLGLHQIGVDVPRNQACCGALHLHEGDKDQADQLARINRQAFGGGNEPLLFTASGCGAVLTEYAIWHDASAEDFAGRCREITDYLAELDWSAWASRVRASGPVYLHTPCSQRNVLKQADAARRLLRRFPELALRELPDNTRCCGAAGSSMLRFPEQADTLAADKVDAISDESAVILSTNIGCALHLQAAMTQRGRRIRVLHPATWLWEQLKP